MSDKKEDPVLAFGTGVDQGMGNLNCFDDSTSIIPLSLIGGPLHHTVFRLAVPFRIYAKTDPSLHHLYCKCSTWEILTLRDPCPPNMS